MPLSSIHPAIDATDFMQMAEMSSEQREISAEQACLNSRLLRVMAHPMRLMILEKLCQCPHCVKHLNSLIDISQPQLSQHMAALRKEKLIACHSCGPVRCYYISQPSLVKPIIELLQKDHEILEMDCASIVAQARQGWEEGKCAE